MRHKRSKAEDYVTISFLECIDVENLFMIWGLRTLASFFLNSFRGEGMER